MKDNLLVHLGRSVKKIHWNSILGDFSSSRAFQIRLIIIPLVLAALSFVIASILLFRSIDIEIARITQATAGSSGTLEEENRISLKTAQDIGRYAKEYYARNVIPYVAVIFGVIAVLGVLMTNRIFDPVRKLSVAARQIAARQWDVNIPIEAPGEVGELARAFLNMKNDLYAVLTNLEDRVVERTQALARRTIQLQTASEVANEITATRNFELLMDRTVNLLVDRFSYDHAGIFLLDTQHEYAVLQAASGDSGRMMLEQGHQLRLGASSVVGTVASIGEPKIALDAGADAVYFRNSLFPNIRSELALPLEINQRIIGVLDVQSREENAFSQQDLDVLQILADQLSIAIDTARLFQQHLETVHQLETLQNQISSDVWVGLSQSVRFNGYQLDAAGLRPYDGPRNSEDVEPSPYLLPIKIRGKVVAKLEVWPAGKQMSLEELQLLELLGDRLSQAIESARIFEETQKRAGREQAVNEFVSALSGSFDLDSLIQTAVRHLGSLPEVTGVSIRIDPSQESSDS